MNNCYKIKKLLWHNGFNVFYLGSNPTLSAKKQSATKIAGCFFIYFGLIPIVISLEGSISDFTPKGGLNYFRITQPAARKRANTRIPRLYLFLNFLFNPL